MPRKTLPLTLDRYAELPAPCRTCLFWELDPVRRRDVRAGEEPSEKEAWLSQVLREWGSCGRIAVVDDVPVGVAIYVPESFVPGVGVFPTAPVSPDAVLLTTIWIDPRHRGGGIGRLLIQGMARDLINRGGIRAVEAFGDRRGRYPCAAPADFLARVGFKTHRQHESAPRLRMDLKGAVTWREEVEAALERLLGVVRPAKQPAPKATRGRRVPKRPLPQHREAPGQ